MRTILFLLLLVTAPLCAETYFFEDFQIDFPGPASDQMNEKLSTASYLDIEKCFLYAIAVHDTDNGFALKDYLDKQRQEAAVLGTVPTVWKLTVQGYPATCSVFSKVLLGKKTKCMELVVSLPETVEDKLSDELGYDSAAHLRDEPEADEEDGE